MSTLPTALWSGRRRPTLGLLTANIHLGVGSTLWSGVVRGAEQHNVNLVCLPGDEIVSGSPRNDIYDLISTRRLDGMICWSSAIGLSTDSPISQRVLHQLSRIATVSLNRTVGDHQTLVLDSYQGMCDAINHLIEVHGKRRLAFVKGPTANPVTADRYRAYLDTLARHGIAFDPRLVSSPVEFRREAGALAMQVLLDVRGIRAGTDFDGLVACSDFFAADALRMLRDRDIRVPEDVAVVSFNDSPDAWTVEPPLTSVSMPFTTLGRRAVEVLVARLLGEEVPDGSSIPTRLVVRRSCGCTPDLERPLVDADRWHYEQTARNLRALGTSLITTTDTAGLGRELAGRLLSVGVRSCYLALYDEPDGLARSARLAFAYDDSGLRTPSLPPYPAALIVPDEVLPRHRRHHLVVEPLHVGPEHFGFAAFEADPQHGSVFRAIGDQISAALKGIRLYQELRHARDVAKRADRVKSSLLTAVSDELRTPLQAILDRTSHAPAFGAQAELLKDIRASAEHQLDVINDLLDLSHAEIDALDLTPELLNPGLLLEELFHTALPRARQGVDRLLALPIRLPVIRADPDRLRQALLNVLTTADRLTPAGQLTLSAEVRPARLTISFTCADSTIPAGLHDDIFEPFVVTRLGAGHRTGLGLAVARRVIALHGGSLSLERGPAGDAFRISLPFPTPDARAVPVTPPEQHHLLVIGGELPRELSLAVGVDLLDQTDVRRPEDIDRVADKGDPTAVLWDPANARQGGWALVRRMAERPEFRDAPFLLYDSHSAVPGAGSASSIRIRGSDLIRALEQVRPGRPPCPIAIIDGDPRRQEQLRTEIERRRLDVPVMLAGDGTTPLFALTREQPGVVVLTHPLPDSDGFDLLDSIRCKPSLHDVPVLLMVSDQLSVSDAQRTEPHRHVVLAGTGILAYAEVVSLLDRMLTGDDGVPQHTSIPVRRAVAWLHQHHQRPITRRQVAQAAGLSEDYVSRMFHRQYGIGPWEYLNRLRIRQAKLRLRETDESIQTVARKVGFRDRAYFSRTFRKLTDLSPQAYRAQESR